MVEVFELLIGFLLNLLGCPMSNDDRSSPPPNMLKEGIPTGRGEILEIRQLIEKLSEQITHNAVRGYLYELEGYATDYSCNMPVQVKFRHH